KKKTESLCPLGFSPCDLGLRSSCRRCCARAAPIARRLHRTRAPPCTRVRHAYRVDDEQSRSWTFVCVSTLCCDYVESVWWREADDTPYLKGNKGTTHSKVRIL
ncbi:unnamed protein product, partial [Ectocarpus fasciculatus]